MASDVLRSYAHGIERRGVQYSLGLVFTRKEAATCCLSRASAWSIAADAGITLKLKYANFQVLCWFKLSLLFNLVDVSQNLHLAIEVLLVLQVVKYCNCWRSARWRVKIIDACTTVVRNVTGWSRSDSP